MESSQLVDLAIERFMRTAIAVPSATHSYETRREGRKFVCLHSTNGPLAAYRVNERNGARRLSRVSYPGELLLLIDANNPRIPKLRIRESRCYELAYLGQEKAPEWNLVHGIVNGPPSVINGKAIYSRIGHAWLEFGGLIYDGTTDDVNYKDEFTDLVKAVSKFQYTRSQAAHNVATTGHFGPWDDLGTRD
jgi:hypothetical protein